MCLLEHDVRDVCADVRVGPVLRPRIRHIRANRSGHHPRNDEGLVQLEGGHEKSVFAGAVLVPNAILNA